MLNIAELKTLNANIAKLYESAFAKARAYGGVINGKDAKAIEKAEKEAQEAIAAFNREATETAYKQWLSTDTPVLSALQAGGVSLVSLKVSNGKDGKTVEVNTSGVIVNLSDFDKYAASLGKSIMARSSWRAAMEEARKVFSGSCALETQEEKDMQAFRKTFDDTFAMNASGARANCGEKTIDQRYSLNSCVRALQEVMDAVLYIDESKGGKNMYRVLRSDMNVVRLTISKRGKNLHTISFPSAAAFQKNVTDALIRIVNNGKYTCEYTTAK